MKSRWLLFFLLPLSQLSVIKAQQRPLLTEPVETVNRGAVRLELGFEFLQEAAFPLSGLEGDLTRVGVLGVRLGVGDRVELQILGSLQDFLNVDRRFAAPQADQLDFSGNSTSDVGDFTLATKIRLNQERSDLPAFGVRFGMELPNASNQSGLGVDETNVFGSLLVEKNAGPLRVLGNVGLVILGDPLEMAAQDDLFIYGTAFTLAVHPKLNLLAEINGRVGPGDVGTLDQSRLRAGAQIKAGGLYWDVAGFWGLEDTDPSSGVIVGVSKTFQIF